MNFHRSLKFSTSLLDTEKDSASSCNIYLAASFRCSVKPLRFVWEITFSACSSFICWSSVLVSSLALLLTCFCAKSLLLLVWQVDSTCVNFHQSSVSVDFSYLTGRGTINETNCRFPMASFFFMVTLVLEVSVTVIWK